MNRSLSAAPALPALALMIVALLGAACGGPGMKRLTTDLYQPLDRDAHVDVYVGKIDPPFAEIAKIDSDAFAYINDDIKQRQLDQLRDRARQLGANTIDEVRILTKEVQGFTPDEAVPFDAVQQGKYPLYFMRATAIWRKPQEPASIAEIQPASGWATDKYSPPPRLESVLGSIPMPALRDQATSATATQPAS